MYLPYSYISSMIWLWFQDDLELSMSTSQSHSNSIPCLPWRNSIPTSPSYVYFTEKLDHKSHGKKWCNGEGRGGWGRPRSEKKTVANLQARETAVMQYSNGLHRCSASVEEDKDAEEEKEAKRKKDERRLAAAAKIRSELQCKTMTHLLKVL